MRHRRRNGTRGRSLAIAAVCLFSRCSDGSLRVNGEHPDQARLVQGRAGRGEQPHYLALGTELHAR